ncbi:hypothetical protein C4J81_16385 [Deltaproteobacteria bacterium Smac51]|nr:hypothetical protein C4J81_16385 [Deltaproteobacteria bacterium Smac51]
MANKSLPADALEQTEVIQETLPAKVMYIGPNLIKPIPLTHRSVFVGLPESRINMLENKQQQAAVRKCFVGLKEAGAALRELEGVLPVGNYTAAYKQAQSLFKE